ncbi:MAG: AraC family ligand binding domain-containing protein [Anaerolineae bacterium]|nr:AraC family ligand binding domain-containing protein [Anaerolineae bacterium]
MYQPNFYNSLSIDQIEANVIEEGFDPLRIADPPGHVYPPHTHPETKLLAFLRGGMDVVVAGQTYRCKAGDRLLIPGNVEHAARVTDEGCVYFWSEKVV